MSPSTPSCTVRVREIFIALDSKNGNVWLALPCSGSQTKPAFWRADRGVMKQDTSRWRPSNRQPLHALCLVRPLSGRQARNIRPASKVAYATTDITVFSKMFYKNPSGVKSATQNLHNKGKPVGINTDKHSTQRWRGASGVECGFQYTPLRCAASGHLSLRLEHGSQGLGESNGCRPSGRSLSLANYSTFCDECLNYAVSGSLLECVMPDVVEP